MIDLDALILLVFLLLKKVLSASSHGHLIAAKEFRSQCRILCFKIAPRRRPKGVQGVQNEPRGMLEASKRRPKVLKKCPGGAKLDLLVFYSVFKRPQSLGGMRGGALITYRLGRLTELNLHIYPNFSAHSRKPALP